MHRSQSSEDAGLVSAHQHEIDVEFQLHIDLTVDDLVAAGWTHERALREAHQRFGSTAKLRNQCLRTKSRHHLTTGRASLIMQLLQDLRYTFRMFRRERGFVAATLGTLALGIGASTTIFSVVDTVVLRDLPYVSADRMVQVGTDYGGSGRLSSVSPLNFFDWRAQSDAFDILAASRLQSMSARFDERPEQIRAAGVSAGFFELLGASAYLGRTITIEDDRPSSPRTVVLSHGAWQRRWGGTRDVIGQDVTLSGQSYSVIGVMPESFVPLEAIYHGDVEVWLPLTFVDDDLTVRDNGFLQVVGRLRGQTTVSQAVQSLNTLQQSIYSNITEENEGLRRFRSEQVVAVASLHEQTVGASRDTLLIFLGAVGLLLAIACANVANLYLARATDRDREVALRSALGASKQRITRQFLTESVVTSLIGGTLGVVVALGGVALFKAFVPDGVPRIAEVGVDLRILFFAAGVSVAVGLVFGLAPIMRIQRVAATQVLKEGALTATAGRQRHVVRSALVVSETSLALILLLGAGLLLNSFVRRIQRDPGFDPNNVVRAALFLEGYESPESRTGFFDAVLEDLSGLPGIVSASATANLPMTPNASGTRITLLGSDVDPLVVDYHGVAGRFFETLGIRVEEGRVFTDDDVASARVAVVNRALASEISTFGDVIGSQFKFGNRDSQGEAFTIIGVVNTIDQHMLGEPAGPSLYLSHHNQPFRFGNIVVRTAGDPTAAFGALREAIWRIDPALPIQELGSLPDVMGTTITEPKFFTFLLTTFATVATVLACVGVFGAMSYTVRQRTREVGVRIALGAKPATIVTMVLKQGMVLVGTGAVLGIVGTVATGPLLNRMLFDVGRFDVATYVAVVALLVAVGALACWLPARAAIAGDPMRALRID